MSSNESAAYEIMKSLDVDYVLIIFGGVIGYSGDDINKFLWMVRIAEGEHPRDIRVRDVTHTVFQPLQWVISIRRNQSKASLLRLLNIYCGDGGMPAERKSYECLMCSLRGILREGSVTKSASSCFPAK